jgi:hypothetical protein
MFFQFHYYCWDRPDNLNDIGGYLKKREQLNTPVWVGETGEKNNTIYFATTQYFEKNNIGWSFWPWKKMETINTPYSIKAPGSWKEVADYSRNPGAVTASDPDKVFNELLENIKLENCVFFSDVVNSMFRQVPLKLEAENYGHDGFGKSYMVHDTTKHSKTYRKKEPVPIVVIENNDRNQPQGQYISLKTGEWTAYKVYSSGKDAYNVLIKLKATSQPATLEININGKKSILKTKGSEWDQNSIKNQQFKSGENEIRITAKKGNVDIDWIDIQ